MVSLKTFKLKVMRTMDFIQWNRVWESRIDASESWIASGRVWKRCNLLLCEQFRKITASLMDKSSKIIKWKAWNIQKFWIRNSDSEWLLIWLLKRIAGRLSNEESPIEGYHIKVAAHIEQCSASVGGSPLCKQIKVNLMKFSLTERSSEWFQLGWTLRLT